MSDRKAEIAGNLQEVKERIVAAAKSVNRDPIEIQLIVVTKTFPVSDIEILRDLGESNFGENRDQEAGPKAEAIPATWHFQGQIQSNKIKSICEWAGVVHSISSEKEILKFAQSARKHQVFLQVSLDGQEDRGGASPADLAQLADLVNESNNLELLGLMAVAPLGVEPMKAFSDLAQINQGFAGQYPDSKFLSAGMSGDFEEAIKHGATHIRIGSSILGSRSLNK
jgi:pyridoxal phosphate enzyme (YggS family)